MNKLSHIVYISYQKGIYCRIYFTLDQKRYNNVKPVLHIYDKVQLINYNMADLKQGRQCPQKMDKPARKCPVCLLINWTNLRQKFNFAAGNLVAINPEMCSLSQALWEERESNPHSQRPLVYSQLSSPIHAFP